MYGEDGIGSSDLHKAVVLRLGIFRRFAAAQEMPLPGAIASTLRRAPNARYRPGAVAATDPRAHAGQRTLLQVTLADPLANVDTLRSACDEALQLGAQEQRLIDALLTLATSGSVERWEPLDLADQARTVLTDRHDDASRLGIAVEVSLRPAPISGDPRLVASLISNLVDNAIRHNRPDGTMTVQTNTAPGRAQITVTNTGPVVPADQLDRLFRPFQHGGAQRVGRAEEHGLGLAIVEAITNAHHAALTAQARRAGGLDIEITFPSPEHPTDF